MSSCREPDVMLFHHRAKTIWLPRLDSHQDQRGQSPTCCCYTTRQGLVEPEVVATSPCRIKSPMPVCCGFDSMKWWAREDLHLQGSQTLDLRGLLFPLNHSPENETEIGSSSRCCPDRNSLQKKSAGCCMEAKSGRSLRCCPGHSGLMKPT